MYLFLFAQMFTYIFDPSSVSRIRGFLLTRKQHTETKCPIYCRMNQPLNQNKMLKETTFHIVNTAALRDQLPRVTTVHLNEKLMVQTNCPEPVLILRRARYSTEIRYANRSTDRPILQTHRSNLRWKDRQNLSGKLPKRPQLVHRLKFRLSRLRHHRSPKKGSGNDSMRKETRFRTVHVTVESWNGG